MRAPTKSAVHVIRTAPGLLIAVTFFLGFSNPGRAVIWQGTNWAVIGQAEGSVAYDSNLFARTGGGGDGYATISPTVTVERLDSLTSLRLEAMADSYTFFNRRELDAIDRALKINLRYPFDPDLLATEQLELLAAHRTEANGEFGLRLAYDDYRLDWTGRFALSGKTSLIARAKTYRTDYVTPGFNLNQAASAGLGAAFVANDKLQLGAGYDFEHGSSRPNDHSRGEVQRDQHLYALRGGGEFLPKVSGTIFSGVSENRYQGIVRTTEWDFAAGASVAWKIRERSEFALNVARLTDFSPDGTAVTRFNAGIEWSEEIQSGIFFTAGARIERVSYHWPVYGRFDRVYAGNIGLRYALTGRFSATVAFNFSSQNSNEAFGTYDRGMVHAGGLCRF